MLCWGTRPEVLGARQLPGIAQLEAAGPTGKIRGAGACRRPPPGGHKDGMIRLPPEDEIDVVLDLTGQDKPLLAALGPLIRAAAPAP